MSQHSPKGSVVAQRKTHLQLHLFKISAGQHEVGRTLYIQNNQLAEIW
jgi:hypothetical protein